MVRHPLLLAFAALVLGSMAGCSRHPQTDDDGLVATRDDATPSRPLAFDRPLPDEPNCSFSMRQVADGEKDLALSSHRCAPDALPSPGVQGPSHAPAQLPLLPASSRTSAPAATSSGSNDTMATNIPPPATPLPTGAPMLLPTTPSLDGRYEVTLFQDDRPVWTAKLAKGTSATANRAESFACPSLVSGTSGSDISEFSATQSDTDISVKAMIRHDHICVNRSATDEVLSFFGAPTRLKVGEKALLATSAGAHPRLRAEITRRE